MIAFHFYSNFQWFEVLLAGLLSAQSQGTTEDMGIKHGSNCKRIHILMEKMTHLPMDY